MKIINTEFSVYNLVPSVSTKWNNGTLYIQIFCYLFNITWSKYGAMYIVPLFVTAYLEIKIFVMEYLIYNNT